MVAKPDDCRIIQARHDQPIQRIRDWVRRQPSLGKILAIAFADIGFEISFPVVIVTARSGRRPKTSSLEG
jgi:hypothetical protein